VPIAEQMADMHSALVDFERYAHSLDPEQWAAIGLHPVRGEMSAHQIVELVIVDHLEEHADQLDGLRAT
jgi:hypothetical protein